MNCMEAGYSSISQALALMQIKEWMAYAASSTSKRP